MYGDKPPGTVGRVSRALGAQASGGHLSELIVNQGDQLVEGLLVPCAQLMKQLRDVFFVPWSHGKNENSVAR